MKKMFAVLLSVMLLLGMLSMTVIIRLQSPAPETMAPYFRMSVSPSDMLELLPPRALLPNWPKLAVIG